MKVAVIIPCLNQAAAVEGALRQLAPLRRRGGCVIVVDGGSSDDTVRRAAAAADMVISSPRGRALQCNAGARAPLAQSADVLLFLPADSTLPPDADRLVLRALANSTRRWGRFDIALAGGSRWLPWIAALINRCSRLTGICSGDQAIFVERGIFLALEGFAPIALAEDIDFSRRARQISPPLALAARVVASGRRWEQRGPWHAFAVMCWRHLA